MKPAPQASSNNIPYFLTADLFIIYSFLSSALLHFVSMKHVVIPGRYLIPSCQGRA